VVSDLTNWRVVFSVCLLRTAVIAVATTGTHRPVIARAVAAVIAAAGTL